MFHVKPVDNVSFSVDNLYWVVDNPAQKVCQKKFSLNKRPLSMKTLEFFKNSKVFSIPKPHFLTGHTYPFILE